MLLASSMMAHVFDLAAAMFCKSLVLLFSALLFLFGISVSAALVYDRVTLLAIESSMTEKDNSSSSAGVPHSLLSEAGTSSGIHSDAHSDEGKRAGVQVKLRLEAWSNW